MRGEADMMTGPARDWEEVLATLGPIFCERAAKYDSTDAFVAENYADMRAAKLFSALVPKELGGGDTQVWNTASLSAGLEHRPHIPPQPPYKICKSSCHVTRIVFCA
jgi:alkylation response protein AidB-like acyl-CoA dehydrogenase